MYYRVMDTKTVAEAEAGISGVRGHAESATEDFKPYIIAQTHGGYGYIPCEGSPVAHAKKVQLAGAVDRMGRVFPAGLRVVIQYRGRVRILPALKSCPWPRGRAVEEAPKAHAPKLPKGARVWRVEHQHRVTCRRCGGSGVRRDYMHIQNGVCFGCGGTGKVAKATKRSVRVTLPGRPLVMEEQVVA